jgi:hypothetical protein
LVECRAGFGGWTERWMGVKPVLRDCNDRRKDKNLKLDLQSKLFIPLRSK